MNTRRTHNFFAKTVLYYSLLFIFVSFFTFLPFFICKKTLVWDVDGFRQHIPVLQKIRSLIHSFLSNGEFSFWSWDIGLGADTIGNLAHVLFDPFEYIAALFPSPLLDLGYSISIILRLYAAGISFLIFGNSMNLSRSVLLTGSLGYAFCTWMTKSGLRQSIFLLPAILFPLLILGIEKCLQKKSPLLFILIVAWSLVSSVYFSYMAALGSLLYLIIRYVCAPPLHKKTLIGFFSYHSRLFLYTLISILLSLSILIPVIYTLSFASKTTGISTRFLFTLKDYLLYLPSFVSTSSIFGNYSYLGSASVFVIMIPAFIYFIHTRKGSVYTVVSILMFVLILFPFISRLFNGLSYPAGRWCYMLMFFYIAAGCEMMGKYQDFLASDKFFKSSLIWIAFLSAWVILICNLIAQPFTNTGVETVISFCTLLLGIAALLCLRKAPRTFFHRTINTEKIILGILIINVILINNLDYSPNLTGNLKNHTEFGEIYEKLESSSQRIVDKIKDDSFYRTDQTDDSLHYNYAHTPVNENIYFGNRSIYTYFSTISSLWSKYNKDLGNNAGYFTRVSSYSNDNRTRMDLLFGVKYFLGDNKEAGIRSSQYAGYGFEPFTTIDGIEILKNKYCIGLGTVYENCITVSEFMKLSPLEREQALMQAAVIPDNSPASKRGATLKSAHDLSLNTESVPYTVISENNASYTARQIRVSKKNGGFTIHTDKVRKSEIYVHFKNLKRNITSYNNTDKNLYDISREIIHDKDYGEFNLVVQTDDITKKALNPADKNQAFPNINDFYINLGYYDSFSKDIEISFSAKGDYTFESLEIISVPISGYDQQAQKLQKNSLNISSFRDNTVEGTFTSEADGLLYLSIPYNAGWKITVDGNNITDPILTNVGFMGIPVEGGTHFIKMEFRPFGFKLGILGTLAGISLLISFSIHFRKRSDRKVQ